MGRTFVWKNTKHPAFPFKRLHNRSAASDTASDIASDIWSAASDIASDIWSAAGLLRNRAPRVNGECVTLLVMFGWLLPLGKFDFIFSVIWERFYEEKRGKIIQHLCFWTWVFFLPFTIELCAFFSRKSTLCMLAAKYCRMRRTLWILFCDVRDLIKGGRFYIEISFRLFGSV